MTSFQVVFGNFFFGKASVTGRKRNINQDSVDIFLPDEGSSLPPLIALADGMGGHKGGETASRVVLEAFRDVYYQAHNTADLTQVLKKCVDLAHQRVKQQASADSALSGMGSTVVAAFLGEDKIHLVNVGDSRAYLIQGEEVVQVSHDQSLVADLVRAGKLHPNQALKHPKRNVLSMAINAKRPVVTPFLTEVTFSPSDILLLCSDGLWGVVNESFLWAAANEFEPQEAAEKLTKFANQRGGPDNISVVVARRMDRKTIRISSDETTDLGE